MEIKMRQSRYCNLKLLLLFLVVYGHLIETRIGASTLLRTLYRLIYLVHMPLFVFLSGQFLRSARDCMRQARRMLLLYLGCQSVVVAVSRLTGGSQAFLTPYWHLWYLLSLGCWCMAGAGYFLAAGRFPFLASGAGRTSLLVLAVLGACLAGDCPGIGRQLSLSRSIVFLPWFLAGLFCPQALPWRRMRGPAAAALLLALAAFGAWGGKNSTTFLYGADGYGSLGLLGGAWRRLLCYGLSFGLGFFLLTFVPGRRLPFSHGGDDTLPVYLLHAPLVKALRALPIPAEVFAWLSPLAAVYVVAVLYLLHRPRGAVCAMRDG